jgi:hypothetical protein
MKSPSLSLLACLLAAGNLVAQSPQDPKEIEERLKKLEAEVQALKQAAKQPEVPAAQLGGAGGAASKALNPDISVAGDLRGAVGSNEVRPVPALELHEVELGLQAIIDPYARGDIFLAISKEGVEVEEGYLTFTALPWGLRARVGKLRAEFGKVNTTHNHALPWIDRPVVTENLVNGEEGISDMGLSLSTILPAPGDFFLEATGQVFAGNSGTLFQATERKDVSFVGHLRGYQDLTDNTNLEIGLSHARGHNELGSAFRTILNGADLTLRWKPLARSIYNSFLWRTEAVWSHRDQLDGPQRSFGLYSSLDLRLSQRWTVGTRYDWSQRAINAQQLDRGASLLATYWFSEFSQLRGQYRRVRYDGRKDASELRLQLSFVLGAHGAHAF